jgi:hypothetical protein
MKEDNVLASIERWHQRARPERKPNHLGIQIGCHAEEFVEMLQALEPTEAVLKAIDTVDLLAGLWKSGTHYPVIKDRRELLDSLADQIVTAVGVGHCAEMNVPEACDAVDWSNWSKFDAQGNPLFDANGKILKGPRYGAPDLTGMF